VMPLFRDLARDWPQNSHGPRDPRRTLVNSGQYESCRRTGPNPALDKGSNFH